MKFNSKQKVFFYSFLRENIFGSGYMIRSRPKCFHESSSNMNLISNFILKIEFNKNGSIK